MNRQQIEWAERHDWYRGADEGTGTVYVQACGTNRDGTPFVLGLEAFTDFQSLRDWAGY